MYKPTWISEKEAAEIMNYSQRYLRRRVKSGELAISYRTNDKGRIYEYDLKAIERVKNQNAFIVQVA
jgi:predicted site-specific integrase-resolvase